MKATLAICSVAIALCTTTLRVGAEIIAGPITNPANGHDYYLLSPNGWTTSEAEAESLGGTLAVINNAKEQDWVYSTFSSLGGVNRGLWIGLHKNSANAYVWVTGAPTNYLNWGPGQPDNAGNVENAAHMWMPGSSVQGTWNDAPDASPNWGVVELPGRADKIVLSKRDRALVGIWYEGGKIERPCWIACTDNFLFVIPNNRVAVRAGFCADGTLFAPGSQSEWPMTVRGFGGFGSSPGSNPQTGLHGQIFKDKILWSNGTWWSRKPVEYGNKEASPGEGAETESGEAQK